MDKVDDISISFVLMCLYPCKWMICPYQEVISHKMLHSAACWFSEPCSHLICLLFLCRLDSYAEEKTYTLLMSHQVGPSMLSDLVLIRL